MKSIILAVSALSAVTACASTDGGGRLSGESTRLVRANVPLPIGLIVPYGGPVSDPATRQALESQGWLVCDGTEVPQNRYTALYALVQDRYGQANDPAKFKLPNLTSRTVYGAMDDNMGQSATDHSLAGR